ncbi:hypothetical protein HG15A2_31490 [Adhaeretor mobilis]|uniref:Uncharacterized protein n=1 Tax=Adhaeretor mobilis TaxID=1930276 RepID=A0A517MY64_9BACT|nr:hypothetical protein HG15A2_31490 [Adhaeretor mobilis]
MKQIEAVAQSLGDGFFVLGETRFDSEPRFFC